MTKLYLYYEIHTTPHMRNRHAGDRNVVSAHLQIPRAISDTSFFTSYHIIACNLC